MKTFFRNHPGWTVFFLVFLLLSLGTVNTEINKLDVRFALFVQEFDWTHPGIFPTLNGFGYPDYLVPWTAASWITSFGGRFLNLFTLALPTIIVSALTVVMTWKAGERVKPGLGYTAAALLIMVPEFLFSACGFGMDTVVMAVGAAMLLILQKNFSSFRTHLIFAGLLLISIAVRGSLGIVVFGSAVAGWVLASRKWKQVLTFGVTGAVVSLLGIGAILGIILLQGGRPLLEWCMEWQIEKRVEGGDYFYYFYNSIFAFAPAVPVMIFTLIFRRREIHQEPLPGWIGFVLLPALVLSIPGGKHMRYLLIALPAASLIGAWGLLSIPSAFRERVPLKTGKWLGFLPLAALTGGVVLMTVCFLLYPAETVPVFGMGTASLLFLFLFLFRKRFSGEKGILLLTVLSLTLVWTGLVIPFNGMRENCRIFVRDAEKLRKGILWCCELGPDHEDLKYCMFIPHGEWKKLRFLLLEDPEEPSEYRQMFLCSLLRDVSGTFTGQELFMIPAKKQNLFAGAMAEYGYTVTPVLKGNLGHKKVLILRAAKVKKAVP